ncbi:PHP domain-containing protein [Candidatus Gracilibacteria bacterium]|nr:PHP domain-containing protein [Candidatus Gracilibacteria bacterium]
MNIYRGDMHFHTDASDGYATWEERLESAIKKGLHVVTPTDHDIVTSPQFIESAREQGIFTWPSVEISAHNPEQQYSLHITHYANHYNDTLNDVLAHTREQKESLTHKRLEVLLNKDFSGSIDDFIDFFKKQGRSKASLNKFDMAHYLLSYEKNMRIVQGILGDSIKNKKFIHQVLSFYESCLKDDQTFPDFYNVRVPKYEPDIDLLYNDIIGRDDILCIAHPNHTFKTIERFRNELPYYVERGVNAVEINSCADKDWVQAIYQVIKKYNLILTLGSDNHKPGMTDNKHGDFGVLNPNLSQDQIGDIFTGVVKHMEK